MVAIGINTYNSCIYCKKFVISEMQQSFVKPVSLAFTSFVLAYACKHVLVCGCAYSFTSVE